MEEDGDFTACRFDFRIDNKNGLTPSRRKKAERRQVNYNTLFKCKVCGSLFESRPALLAHKLVHSEFKCDYCPDTFQKKSIWRLHLSKVHGVQPDNSNGKKGGSGAVSKSVRNLLPATKDGEEDKESMQGSPEPPVTPLTEVKSEPPSTPQPIAPPPLIPPPPPGATAFDQPQTPVASPCGFMASPVVSNANIPGFVCINVPIFITSGDGSNTTVTAMPPGALPQGTPTALMPQGLPNMTAVPPGAVLMPHHFMATPPTPVSDATPLPSPSVPVLQPLPNQAPNPPPPPPKAPTPQGNYQQTPPPANPDDLEPGEIRGMKKGNAQQGKNQMPSNTEHSARPSKNPNNNVSVFQVPPDKREISYRSSPSAHEVSSRKPSQKSSAPAYAKAAQYMEKMRSEQIALSNPDQKKSVDSYVIDLSCKKSSYVENTPGTESSSKDKNHEQAFKIMPGLAYDNDKQAMQEQYKDIVDTAASSTSTSAIQSNPAGKIGSMKKGKGAGLSKMVEKLWQTKMSQPETDAGDNVKVQPAVHSRIKSKPSSRTSSPSPIVISPGPSVETLMPPPSHKPVNSDGTFGRGAAAMPSYMGAPSFPDDVALERNDSVELELIKGERPLFDEVNLSKIVKKIVSNVKSGLHITEDPSQVIEMPPASNMTYLSEYADYLENEYPPKKAESDFCTLKFHTCPVCKQLFSSSEAMRQHMKKEHSTRRLTNRTRATKPKAARVRLNCPTCSFKTTSLFTLKHHRITVHPEMFGSTTAPAGTAATVAGPTQAAGGSAASAAAPKETRIKCRFPGCGRVFKELRHLRVHQTHHTCESPVVCELCNYSCRHRSSMNLHMKTKHNLEKFKGHDNRTVYIDEHGMVMTKAMDELDPPESPEMLVDENINIPETSVAGAGGNNIQNPTAEEPMEIAPEESVDSPLDMSIRAKSATPDLVINTEEVSPNSNQTIEDKPMNPELSVYKIEASPGPEPKFFTSVMKFNYKSAGNKSQASSAAQENRKCTCKCCNKTFEDAECMWKHKLEEHLEETKFLCDSCSFQTGSRSELQSHMMSTHGKEVGEFKDYICFICGKGYSSKNGLNHHLMRHSEEGPPGFDCPNPGCKSRLLSKSALKNHIRRVHTKPKAPPAVAPNIDPQDEASVIQNGEERLLVCGYHGCDRTFRESKHLKVHRMQHTDEKPLKCELCFYSCRQRNSMNWHMKSKHGMDKHVTPDGRTIYLGTDDSQRV